MHRSAAIVRKPGAGDGQASSPWRAFSSPRPRRRCVHYMLLAHADSDFTGYSPFPFPNASTFLNRGEVPNGK